MAYSIIDEGIYIRVTDGVHPDLLFPKTQYQAYLYGNGKATGIASRNNTTGLKNTGDDNQPAYTNRPYINFDFSEVSVPTSVSNTDLYEQLQTMFLNAVPGGSGLVSFNGRTAPSAVPTTGDYDYTMVTGAGGYVKITRANLQTLISTNAVKDKTYYQITDAVGTSNSVVVVGTGVNTISTASTNLTTNLFGNYNITSDVFTGIPVVNPNLTTVLNTGNDGGALPIVNVLSYNGLTLTAGASGFTIAGGTSSKTLTVSGNANVSGTNTGDITIGTANGLSLAGQAISMNVSSTSTTGALTNTDWNTFNNKFPTPAGTTAQYIRGDGSLDTFPLITALIGSTAGLTSNPSPGATNETWLGKGAGSSGANTTNTVMIGTNAGSGSTGTNQNMVAIGNGAATGLVGGDAHGLIAIGTIPGVGAINAARSIFMGASAGNLATGAGDSIFMGNQAGQNASNAFQSHFVGSLAGYQATNAAGSNFLGEGAGTSATNANDSHFIGNHAGFQATNAAHSIFIGENAGQFDTVNNVGVSFLPNGFSILIGHNTNTGGFKNSIQLGGIDTGTSSNTAANQFMLVDTITNARISGLEYVFPAVAATVDQVLTATSISGSIATLGWSTPTPSPFINTGGTFPNIYTAQSGLPALTSGTDNVLIGTNTGVSITGGVNNTIMGIGAGSAINTGSSNALFGLGTGASVTSGSNNSMFGVQTITGLTTGIYNAYFGSGSIANSNFSHTAAILVGGTKTINAAGQFYIDDQLTNWIIRGVNYTMPTAAPGTNGFVLSGTTAGVLSWVANGAGGGITYGGAVTTGHNNELLYINGSGNLVSDSQMTRNSSQDTVISQTNLAGGISKFVLNSATNEATMSALDVGSLGGLVDVTTNLATIQYIGSGVQSGITVGPGQLTFTNNDGITNINWIYPQTDAVGSLNSDGAGNLSFGLALAGLTAGQVGVGDGSNLLSGTGDFTRSAWGIGLQDNSGTRNIYIGTSFLPAGTGTTSGAGNVAVGEFALGSIGGGQNNMAYGAGALQSLFNGNNNIAIGNGTLQTIGTGGDSSDIIGIGSGANVFTDGLSNSVGLGSSVIITQSNQFVVGASISTWQIRGIDYVMPGSNNSGFANNDGAGNINWNAISVDGTSVFGDGSGTALSTTYKLIAFSTGISGAALATSQVFNNASYSLANSIPTYVVYKYNSGTLGIAVVKIITSAGDITPTTALVNLTSSNDVTEVCKGVMPNSGDISVQVTTASLAASSFDVYVYGITRP